MISEKAPNPPSDPACSIRDETDALHEAASEEAFAVWEGEGGSLSEPGSAAAELSPSRAGRLPE